MGQHVNVHDSMPKVPSAFFNSDHHLQRLCYQAKNKSMVAWTEDGWWVLPPHHRELEEHPEDTDQVTITSRLQWYNGQLQFCKDVSRCNSEMVVLMRLQREIWGESESARQRATTTVRVGGVAQEQRQLLPCPTSCGGSDRLCPVEEDEDHFKSLHNDKDKQVRRPQRDPIEL